MTLLWTPPENMVEDTACTDRIAHAAEAPAQAFLKWPGGKRWLTSRLVPVIRAFLKGQYIEPFLGGGAAFFALRPAKTLLSDINDDLINSYVQVRDNPEALERLLRAIPVDKQTYYQIRAQNPSIRLERAARFLYLNRTAFGGMYRLNRDGLFNVPYGGGERTPEILWRTGLLSKASHALKKAKIQSSDFECIIDQAVAGDVVYCDPTYTVAHNKNAFVRYNERNFSWTDQNRLATAAKRACARGVFVIISNAAHESISKLYWPFRPLLLERPSLLSPHQKARGYVDEYLFMMLPAALRKYRGWVLEHFAET